MNHEHHSIPSYCYQNDHMATHTGIRLMAPVLPRQFHHFPSPPRPPKETPAIPVPVTRYISVKVFFELFAGTIGIFVLGVLFWKIGKCFRSFTRGKVLREGKTTGTRYARTWYGWVPLHRHEEVKNVFRKCWGKLCDWTSWKTTRADYSWVWWDPGQKAHEEYHQKRFSRWIPKCFRSKIFTPADTIWNRGPPPRQHPRDQGPDGMTGSFPGQTSQCTRPERASRGGSRSGKRTIQRSFPTDREFSIRKPHLPFRKSQLSWSLGRSSHTPRKTIPFPETTRCNPRWLQSVSLPCLLTAKTYAQRPPEKSDATWETCSTSEPYYTPNTLRGLQNSRKYQVWSARVQLQTPNQVKHSHHGLQEPPGTPISELLASYSSENNAPLDGMRGSVEYASDTSLRGLSSLKSHHTTTPVMPAICQDKDLRTSKWNTMPISRGALHLLPSTNVPAERNSPSFVRDTDGAGSFSLPEDWMLPETTCTKERIPARKHLRRNKPRRIPTPLESLSNWETRWVDNLDRKLEWHHDQLIPGKRPFHFPLLPNHWLNRRTWTVIDPASRVPLEKKRLWGDPRFSVPYPAPRWESKPKYPAVGHKAAHTPRIDSWRVAVNGQRRTSGIREVVKAVDLFDDSVDEPPDGTIDPACWVLRKPPQGFGMSAKQGETYYEGGAGWQEKLNDWQRVRRGYRIRRAIHDGRVNRTRVKEIATGISRPCRKAASKATKTVTH